VLPRARIDFLVQAPYRTVLADNPFLDNLVSYPQARGGRYLFHKLALFRWVRWARYDLIIDQLGGTGSAQTVMFSGAAFRIGYAGKRHSRVYSHRVAPPQLENDDHFLYAATQKFFLLKPLGITPEPYRLWYPIQSASFDYVDGWLAAQNLGSQPPLIVSPGGPAAKRRWDSACYAELADLIQTRLARKVLLLWAPRERPTAEEVKARMASDVRLAPATTFNQAAALMSRGALVICHNGGINHLAAAVGAPCLAVFGKVDPRIWAPTLFPRQWYLHNPQADHERDPDFGITPRMMFHGVQHILAQPLPPQMADRSGELPLADPRGPFEPRNLWHPDTLQEACP
jgi:heptosyltransferase-3